MSIRVTTKQLEILRAIMDKQTSGEPHDVYSLMDALSYKPKRDALLHSIRVLVENGLVDRLPRVGRIVPFGITHDGSKYFW